jgi:tRNA G18 (ribose-2'-O)-methylase SpoU
MKKLYPDELKSQRPSLEELGAMNRFPLCCILENIRSLYNVGSMFRTSDGACIEKLYLCGYTGYPPRKEIDKTALGSVESVPWEHNENTLETISDLKNKGYCIAVLEHTSKSKSYNTIEYPFPLCLVAGNEVDGVTEDVIAASDIAVDIPMYGLKESLNVAVAYGIVVYEIVSDYISRFGKNS